MTMLISDPAVTAIPVHENGEPLVALDHLGDLVGGPARGEARLVRRGLHTRLTAAATALPPGVRLHVVEGFRRAASQQAIVEDYSAALRRTDPGLSDDEVRRLSSRYVAPLAVAPHVAGAAVDLTLAVDGRELWMGSALDATPEQSGGACCTDAPGLDRLARANRGLLVAVLAGAGLVNYPTEWWHWSFGDRYWALVTGAPAALYGPVTAGAAA